MTQRLTWPTNRFYWATLDAPGVRRVGPIPTGLLPLLEDDVPANADDLHAVGVPLSGGRLGVCAAEAAALRAVPPGVLSLTPEALPSFLASQGLSPDQFNLLAGAFEPLPLRRRRFHRHAFAAGTVALCAALLAVGLHRRTAHWESYTHDARTASQTIAAEAASVPPHQLAAQASRVRGTLDALAKAAPLARCVDRAGRGPAGLAHEHPEQAAVDHDQRRGHRDLGHARGRAGGVPRRLHPAPGVDARRAPRQHR
ncbi:MAG: hypothetical protein IPM33_09835 [Phycisphaerales bacterium]|nr:hypothetical protein [Phycisphaerales bacterium]